MKTLFLVASLFLTLIASLKADPNWYQPTGWTIGTEIPAQPQNVSEHKTPVPGGEIVESRIGLIMNDDIFIVFRAHLPTPIASDRLDAAYAGGIASLLQGGAQTAESEERVIIAGHIGRRWILKSKDGLRVTDHRTVIIGDDAFEFLYERPAGQSPSTAEAFFSKIAIKKS